MVETTEYFSFLLRIWREQAKKTSLGPSNWTAEVESIQSGDSWRFPDVASPIAFIEETFPAVENDNTDS